MGAQLLRQESLGSFCGLKAFWLPLLLPLPFPLCSAVVLAAAGPVQAACGLLKA
jgi:hypothetical protein